jgi:hypothetical protein
VRLRRRAERPAPSPLHPPRRFLWAILIVIICHDEPGQPCIYCGVGLGTTTEHIIPEAFGGRLTLENASCTELR